MRALTLEFDVGLFRTEAVKKAAYRFSGDYWVAIEPRTPEGLSVTLRPRASGPCDLVEAGAAFRTEVLDQELRLVVAERTAALSSLILAHALSNIAIVEPDLETADFRSDPNGIGHEPRGRKRDRGFPRCK